MSKRDKCEVCGDYRVLNEDGICPDCEQDAIDLEDETCEFGHHQCNGECDDEEL